MRFNVNSFEGLSLVNLASPLFPQRNVIESVSSAATAPPRSRRAFFLDANDDRIAGRIRMSWGTELNVFKVIRPVGLLELGRCQLRTRCCQTIAKRGNGCVSCVRLRSRVCTSSRRVSEVARKLEELTAADSAHPSINCSVLVPLGRTRGVEPLLTP